MPAMLPLLNYEETAKEIEIFYFKYFTRICKFLLNTYKNANLKKNCVAIPSFFHERKFQCIAVENKYILF